MPPSESTSRSPMRRDAFQTTRWSMVLAAQGRATTDGFQSLESLCRLYWPPLYAYVRRRGHSPHDAQDLTQEFFARLLAKDWLTAAHRESGRFRSFLLMALKRFLANEWDRVQAQKRGGGVHAISIDSLEAERIYAESASATAAESLYEKRWAFTLLETVMRRLRSEHEQAGRLADYERLKHCLTADRGEIAYDDLAAEMGMEPDSVRSVVHRLRKRFREGFREEVAETVADPADVEDEMRAVIAALGAA